ncbi:MAG: hypothetical protein ABUL72_00615, partial [Armatimonadota bacterium]
MVNSACQAGRVAFERVRRFGLLLFVCLGLCTAIMTGLYISERLQTEASYNLKRTLTSLEQLEHGVRAVVEPVVIPGATQAEGGLDLREVARLKAMASEIEQTAAHTAFKQSSTDIKNNAVAARDLISHLQSSPKDAVTLGRDLVRFEYSSLVAKSNVGNGLTELELEGRSVRGLSRLGITVILLVLGIAAWFGNLKPLRKMLRDWSDDQQSLLEANQTLEQQSHQIEAKTEELQRL